MSTDVEDQVRAALQEIADDARPAPLMRRLEATPIGARSRLLRKRSMVGAVAAVVVALLVAALMWRAEHTHRIDPAEQPPKVITLSESGTLSPGRVLLAISLAADSENDNTPSYLLTSKATEAVLLPHTGEVQGHWTQHLSADGTSFVRQWLADPGGRRDRRPADRQRRPRRRRTRPLPHAVAGRQAPGRGGLRDG